MNQQKYLPGVVVPAIHRKGQWTFTYYKMNDADREEVMIHELTSSGRITFESAVKTKAAMRAFCGIEQG